jgi:uncharacterized protein (DUF433 family)
MSGIGDTAYPQLKSNPSAKELDEICTPNLFECAWVEERTREPVPRIALFVLLKTFQRLGYFVMVNEMPAPILHHVAQCAGYDCIPNGLDSYDGSSLRRRHLALVRDYVGAWAFKGTRMPVIAVFENLEAGATIDEAMTWFDIGREPITAVLEFAARSLEVLPALHNAHFVRPRHTGSFSRPT